MTHYAENRRQTFKMKLIFVYMIEFKITFVYMIEFYNIFLNIMYVNKTEMK